MITVFELLGRILDDISAKVQFCMVWEDDTLSVMCNDKDIIGSLILPLFNDSKVYNLIKNSKWYFATIKMSHDQIREIVLENDSGMSVISRIGTAILENLSTTGMDDTYIKVCHEITKKCGFIVDNVKIV